MRERIECLVGGIYLELFARESKASLGLWGNRVGLFERSAVTIEGAARFVDKAAPLLARPSASSIDFFHFGVGRTRSGSRVSPFGRRSCG